MGNTVKRAALVLDKETPDWPYRINRTLDFGSSYNCVLGQVYGHFDRRQAKKVRKQVRNAFVWLGGPKIEYQWKVEIAARRKTTMPEFRCGLDRIDYLDLRYEARRRFARENTFPEEWTREADRPRKLHKKEALASAA